VVTKHKKGRQLTCRHPDRDCPKLLCGYPLPCPWHTAIIDTTVEPATITIPVTATAAFVHRDRLADVGEALSDPSAAAKGVRS